MRVPGFLLIAVTGIAPLWPALAGQAHTTRIETRPYYGAVVTLEHGVRVYRPLPPTDHMIINPDGRTPMVLNVDDGQVINPSAASKFVTPSDDE